MSPGPGQPKVGVGAVLIHEGRVLLIRRGKEPLRGRWVVPGGTVELGETLFRPFEQAETNFARSERGLGLGLALVRGFVELHGGTVEARSEGPGRGAEFEVRLPLSSNRPKEAARPLPGRRARRGRRKSNGEDLAPARE